jgi:hypothetical protein
MNLTAELGKLAGDKLGRAMLLEAKLGVCVQVSARRSFRREAN